MTQQSVFANGPCDVVIHMHGNDPIVWEGPLALGGQQTFVDPVSSIDYIIAVDDAGEVTLTKAAALGGSPDEWIIDITPPAMGTNVQEGGFSTDNGGHVFLLEVRCDGAGQIDIGGPDPYAPDPYTLSPQPVTSCGIRAIWDGA